MSWTAIPVAAARCDDCTFIASARGDHDSQAWSRVIEMMDAHAANDCPAAREVK